MSSEDEVPEPGDLFAFVSEDTGADLPDDPDADPPGTKVLWRRGGSTVIELQPGKQHLIVLKPPTLELKLRFVDAAGEPIANEPFVLSVQGHLDIEGTSDGDGIATAKVPMTLDARSCRCRVAERDMILTIGALQPLDETPQGDAAGAVQRLRNLGYVPGASPGGAALRRATWLFQSDNGLPPNGKLTAQTLAKLREIHGE